MKDIMKEIVELSQKRWFVYPGSQIYWGLANAWDYGPYWAILKENIKNLWIKNFVQKRNNMMLMDSAILMNPKTWVASGHVWGFSDPLTDCKSCKTRHRADKLIEEDFAKKWIDKVADGMSNEEMIAYLKENNVVCPNCWELDYSDIKEFNLMFETNQWVTKDSSNTVYLRPETAQWIFVNFANNLRTSRRKLPFWVAQVWKSFRNEITPWNFIFRTREFEQMEIEYYTSPEDAPEAHKEWIEACKSFLVNTCWIKEDSIRIREHWEKELAHYADACSDIEFKFPFGFWELWGIANRTDHDLKAHMKESKQDLSYFDQVAWRKFLPYVIEPSVWLTRLFLAILVDSYTVEEERTYLKLSPKLAPITVWVLPVVKKLWDEAKKVYEILSEEFYCEYDDAWSVGKRYARFDEIWTPFCVTIDSENYEAGAVTLRHRDSMEQEIIKIDELNNYIKNKIKTA